MRKAFTLIELLLVMAVIAILIGILLPAFRGMQLEAYRTRVEKELTNVQTAIESYYKNYGSYPAFYMFTSSVLTGATQVLQTMPLDYFGTFTYGSPVVKTFSYATGVDYRNMPFYIVGSKGRETAYTSTYNSNTTAVLVVGDNAVASNLMETKP